LEIKMNLENQTLIRNRLNLLEKMGFSCQVVTTKLTEELSAEELNFTSDKVTLEVSFETFVNCKKVSIYISRNDKNASFSFVEYISFKKDEAHLDGGLDEPDDIYINRFFDIFQKSINTELLDVLKGDMWLDVPKDYGIYK